MNLLAIVTVCTALLVASLTAGPLLAQNASGEGLRTPQASFSAGVEAVTIAVSVRDRRGRVVRDLSVSDFTVLDSGEVVEVLDFYFGDSPVSLALLLDISGSMAVGGNIDRARHAVSVTTTGLRDDTDEAALFTFDSSLREVVPFTRELDRLSEVSLAGTPWGQTSLYDAIAETAMLVSERQSRHRAVLVITDGVDTRSRLSATAVSGVASAIDVPVFLLTVATPGDRQRGRADGSGGERAARTATLGDLARWTGGDMRVASTPEHTAAAVEELFAALRHQYLLSFAPGDGEGWHSIEIRTRDSDFVVRARGWYMSGGSARGKS